MIAQENVIRLLKQCAEGMALLGYEDCPSVYIPCYVSPEDGMPLLTGSIPAVRKEDGKVIYIFPPDFSEIGEYHPLPEREKYRAKFDAYSMEHYGTHYRFPDERDDFPAPGD